MKTPVKLIVAATVMMFANFAFASATMKDVETAVDVNKDYRQAETLIREVVTANPNDARDHYVYSQILHHNHKHDDAVRELAEAKRLDPAISFVKNPAHVAAYEAELNAESSHAVIPMTEPLPVQHKSNKTLIWVLLILAALGGVAYYFFRRSQESERKAEEERMKLARQDQLKQASALLESVKPFKLDIRMASPANPALLAEVEQVEQDLVGLIDRLGEMPVPQSEIDRLSDSLAHLHRKFEGKSEPEPAAQSNFQGTQNSDFSGFSPVGVPTAPVYQQAVPQTVYVENNNGGMGVGGGLLTGMVLGSMMGGTHEREVIHEVREVREVPMRRDDNDGGQSDIDFGNESSSDSGGDIDFGSSDDN
jgi:hypothetical protein